MITKKILSIDMMQQVLVILKLRYIEKFIKHHTSYEFILSFMTFLSIKEIYKVDINYPVKII